MNENSTEIMNMYYGIGLLALKVTADKKQRTASEKFVFLFFFFSFCHNMETDPSEYKLVIWTKMLFTHKLTLWWLMMTIVSMDVFLQDQTNKLLCTVFRFFSVLKNPTVHFYRQQKETLYRSKRSSCATCQDVAKFHFRGKYTKKQHQLPISNLGH